MHQIRGVDYELFERGSGRPVLLLHGFTGQGSWIDRFPDLPARLISPSLLGHGGTSHESIGRMRMSQQVRDLSALLDRDDRPWTVIGYSLGGRIGMTLAACDDRVEHFIGISTTAGLESATLRKERRTQDAALAGFLEQHGIEAFVNRWERLPLWHQTEEMRAALRPERLAQRPEALADHLRAIGTGSMPSVWPMLDRLPRTDLIVGKHDLKFREIAKRMQLRQAHIRIHEIPDAGHAPHIENAQQFGTMIEKLILGGNENGISSKLDFGPNV
ncbi:MULTISPECIES: alpha/beta fold hydrolase [Exiguobacterium]|uniref:alpha/beta fold hydrolase n=1 Tax=Exiguobacterium TaxID=33986 RepID=UPI001BE97C75|nr:MULTISPECIES: alpha/beta fold hydrolase [Exiguobacterium]MCT4782424.1 alpha/beta fold hydrolase [Exiguobacterium himgiriensis]